MNLSSIKSISELGGKLQGQTVFVRVDWNVPVHQGQITDTTRLIQTHETLAFLQSQGAKTILLAHYGRPTLAKAKRKDGYLSAGLMVFEDAFSFAALMDGMNVALSMDIQLLGALDDASVHLSAMHNGDVALLDNIRFYGGEESNDESFARLLIAQTGATLYVNDAFSCTHRAHASTEKLAHLLPAYAGFGLMREVSALSASFADPVRPLWAVVGGAKVSTKIELLQNLTQKVDGIIIGGAMANTFLKAKGYTVGKSLVEEDYVATAQTILDQATADIILPIDAVCASKLDFKDPSATFICAVDAIPDELAIFDAGSSSVALFKDKLSIAKTVIWNGPVGVFEHPNFANASMQIAHFLAAHTSVATTLAGGGDTLAALAQANVIDKLSYCSTAGGAFLEFLEGKALPGLVALARSADCSS